MHPNFTLTPFNDGFLRVTDLIGQADIGGPSTASGQAMAFYNQQELPFYYDLAEKFAIGDRYFASVPGPAFPNRSYLLAATSFGHLGANENFPPPGGYKPITGTLFDLLNANGVSWANYFQDVPTGSSFLPFGPTSADPHFLPLTAFLAQATGMAGAGPLPQVSFIDPNFGLASPASENDERSPTDIQRGQAFVSQVVNAMRDGPTGGIRSSLLCMTSTAGFTTTSRRPRRFRGAASAPMVSRPGNAPIFPILPSVRNQAGVRSAGRTLSVRTRRAWARQSYFATPWLSTPRGRILRGVPHSASLESGFRFSRSHHSPSHVM